MKRVLITNNTLDIRAGTELYVRDICKQLLAKGWNPITYSTILGVVAEEIRALGVPVIDDLTKLAEPPDLIHGHHHLETMTAIQSFPGVPVIHVCHGWVPWEEAPPMHPQIKRYIAANALCRERLVSENGIPDDRVDMVLNFADMDVFQTREKLPKKITKALLFNNHLTKEDSLVQMLRQVCQSEGATLDLYGASSGIVSDNPDQLLKNYDLVFATGRSAIEALAVRCAVVVCDQNGFAGMVTPERLEKYRELNFAYRLVKQCPRPTFKQIQDELKLYDIEKSELVTMKIREEACAKKATTKLVEIYSQVLKEHPPIVHAPTPDQKASAAYLAWLSKEFKAKTSQCYHLSQEKNEKIRQYEVLQQSHRELKDESHRLHGKLNTLENAYANLLMTQQYLQKTEEDQHIANYNLKEKLIKLGNKHTALVSKNENEVQKFKKLRKTVDRWNNRSWFKRVFHKIKVKN